MNIDIPDYLTDEAKEYFTLALKQLGNKAIASDWSILAEYAQAQADVIRLQGEVTFEGETLSSAVGNMYINPKCNVLMARRKDLERYRNDLGLTPKARGLKGGAPGKSNLDKAMGR